MKFTLRRDAVPPTHAEAQLPRGFGAAWCDLGARFHRRTVEEGLVGGSLWFIHDGRVLGREVHGFVDLASKWRAATDLRIRRVASALRLTRLFDGEECWSLAITAVALVDTSAVELLPSIRP